MREQVVSKVRRATQGMPALQKRLLESAKEDNAEWEVVDQRRSLPTCAGLYVVFADGGKCMYLGQTKNLFQRLRSHPKFLGSTVCFIRLKPSDAQLRKSIEGPLARRLNPEFGRPDRHPDCDEMWATLFLNPENGNQ